jgi:signal transduction histidine kinase
VETRRVSHELVPLLLKDYGLQKAIEEFCSRFAGTGIQLDCYCFEQRLSPALEMAIYRISQELVNNIIKHSGASRGRIEVYQDKDYVYIEAQDNGKGIPTEQGKDTLHQERAKGIGLKSIHERVALLEGTIVIETTPGTGTLITIRLPLVAHR